MGKRSEDKLFTERCRLGAGLNAVVELWKESLASMPEEEVSEGVKPRFVRFNASALGRLDSGRLAKAMLDNPVSPFCCKGERVAFRKFLRRQQRKRSRQLRRGQEA